MISTEPINNARHVTIHAKLVAALGITAPPAMQPILEPWTVLEPCVNVKV